MGREDALKQSLSGSVGVQFACDPMRSQPLRQKKRCFISRGGRRCSQNRVGDLKLKSTELDIPSPVLQQARASAKERTLKAKV